MHMTTFCLQIVYRSQEVVTTTEETVCESLCVAQHSSEPVEVQHDDTQEETYQLRYTKVISRSVAIFIYVFTYIQ